MYENINNGIYIQYYDSTTIETMGTYFNGMRNGLWDTLMPNGIQSQIYYKNDSETLIFKHKYHFDYYKYIDYDFTVLTPVNWEVIDSLSSKFYLKSVSRTYEGEYKSQYLIYHVKSQFIKNSDLLQSYYENEVRNNPLYLNFVKISDLHYTYTYIDGNDSINYDNKIIKTNTGAYCMSCSCESKNYYYYFYIFETMLNSFNPISDIKQS
jgi:hypothetical protein